MGTITFSFNNDSKKKNKPDKEKVLLTYHQCINSVPEYFSYINDKNEEVKLDDKSYSITKISSSKYIGKKSVVSKIPVEFVEAKEKIDFKPEYFTYNGNEVYLKNPIYNEETNTYTGILEVVDIYDKEIKLIN